MATTTRARASTEEAVSAVEEALRTNFGVEDPPEVEAPAPETPSPAVRARNESLSRNAEPRRQFGRPIEGRPPQPTRRVPARAETTAAATRAPEPPARRFADRPETVAAEPAVAAAAEEAPALEAPQPAAAAAAARPASARQQRANNRFAANDDRRTAPTAYRRPSRAIYFIAIGVSLLWALGVIVFGISAYGASVFTPGGSDVEGAPNFVSMLLLLALPIMLVWTAATMAMRSQELRTLARSLDGVIAHMTEPEHIASESVVSVSQAIRREFAAVGDGIERAIARASELELMVQNEVSALERSYGDNELRMRSLIEDLASQREAILVNSERVRTSIVRAQESLSEDLRRASDAIASN
ncbi:MAG: hypothetical protein AB7U48_14595, partial [Bauldia sp.]